MIQTELAGSFRAIHFKSVVRAIRRDQSEVMQGRSAESGFLIGY
jgi:hypothetical protein